MSNEGRHHQTMVEKNRLFLRSLDGLLVWQFSVGNFYCRPKNSIFKRMKILVEYTRFLNTYYRESNDVIIQEILHKFKID